METVSKLRRMAADLAGSGKHHQAARIYEQILKSTDRDGDTALRLGALRRKLQDVAGAVASFELAAKLFRRTGHFDKADATERLIAEAQVIRCSPPPRGWRSLVAFVRSI